jgi:hypothetical protein
LRDLRKGAAALTIANMRGILSPEGIAEAYWQLYCQQRSAWTHEMDLRPWIETW